MASMKSFVILAILAGILASCSAETASAEYTDKAPRHRHKASSQPDLDYDKLPRKAVMLKDTEKGDKAAVLRVTVTLSEGQTTCPSKHGDMESMRQYVADAFDTMLKRAHVDAKLKTGTLGCEAILDDDCVKVVLQFVVKLHAKKGSDLLSKFVHVITTAAYSHRAICDIQELGCHAHHVVSIEVEQLAKKPHGTKLHKNKDASNDEDASDADEADESVFSGYSTWTKKTHHSKKHGRYGKHKGAGVEEEAEEDAGSADGYSYSSSNYDSDGSSYDDGSDAEGYGLKAAAVTKPAAVAAPGAAQKAASFKVDTRLWPQESLKVVAAKAAAAKAAAAAAATAPASAAAGTAPASAAAATAAVNTATTAASTASATASAAAGAATTATSTAVSAQHAAAATAAAPQQLNVVPFDARLWPIMPSAQKAAPML